jgi:hypothetical protein
VAATPRRALVAVLLAALALAACSDSGGSDTSSASGTSTSSTPPGGPITGSSTSIAPGSTTDIGDRVARAEELCNAQLDSGAPGRSAVIAAAPMTAAEAAAQLEDAGASAAPWGGLPPEHFVAYCEISTSTSPEAVPTTQCPDGAVVLDVRVTATFVDLDGRVSDASALHPADPCVPPPELP